MKIIVYLFLLLLPLTISSQEYFQQVVQYKIDAVLDDVNHKLRGKVQFKYTNNSTDDLNEMYIHVWPNGYKNRSTAFAQQQLDLGQTEFQYAKQSDLGYIDDLNFKINGDSISWDYWKGNPDIVIIKLSKPLKSKNSLVVSTPFTIKIPKTFSRMGHKENDYQISQWYPKPAVYDKDGWHPMPYLDMGEFYSEFGVFEVKLTVPVDYVVAATGERLSKSDIKFLEDRVKATQAYRNGEDLKLNTFNSMQEMKEIFFVARNVHDFAWFASKDYLVDKSEVILNDGNKVDTWVMSRADEPKWEKAIDYLDAIVKFNSEKIGNYPWPHATVVQGQLSAGEGMEYPMITVISYDGTADGLNAVIAHEVSHNWFYGILASNERDFGWMDEGMTSYYENRYMREQTNTEYSMVINTPDGGKKFEKLALKYLSRQDKDQNPSLTSGEFDMLNYALSLYMKPSFAFRLLEEYVGQEAIDNAFQDYYQIWSFKHPSPEDARASFESSLGKDLDWLFEGYFNGRDEVDYRAANLQKDKYGYIVNVKNKSSISPPFQVVMYQNDSIIYSKWFNGFLGTQEIYLPNQKADKIVLDPFDRTLDANPFDNTIKTKGLFKKVEPLKIKPYPWVENPTRTTISLFPALGFNNYDKFMAGIAVNNLDLPYRRLRYALAPMYGFGSKKLAFAGKMMYDMSVDRGKFRNVTFSIAGRKFAYEKRIGGIQSYLKLAPEVSLKFAPIDKLAKTKQSLSYRHIWIRQQNVPANPDSTNVEYVYDGYGVNELKFTHEKMDALYPFNCEVKAHQAKGMLRFSAEIEQSFRLEEGKNKFFTLRLFGGYLPKFENPSVAGGFAPTGVRGVSSRQYDYTYDQWMLGRSESRGDTSSTKLFTQQIYDRDGGFKTLSTLGLSESWMVSLNAKTSLPGPIPIYPYFNFAIVPKIIPTEGNENGIDKLFEAGIALSLVPDKVEIYFPIAVSSLIKDIGNEYGLREKYVERISFKLDLNLLDPLTLLNRMKIVQ